ncbi:MAG: recombinase family protein [Terriglobales bacterium]|jgi:DNA invertase Pin-like site-specific DNA recombinase
MQLRELREYCQRRNLQILDEYVDKGVSGSRERRPALDRLRIACGKRLVDAVVVYRYDRFARSLRQLVNALEEFRVLGIDFISLHEKRRLLLAAKLCRWRLSDKRSALGFGGESLRNKFSGHLRTEPLR